MEYRFYIINEKTGVQIEIEEPIGFGSFVPKIKRDPKAHGLTFEYADQKLSFDREAYNMIVNEYNLYGVDAALTFLVEYDCQGYWTEFYRGTIDYATYGTETGELCLANAVIGQTGVLMTFNSRVDTKVDIESLTTLDGSSMSTYTNLGKELEIPSKTIYLEAQSEMTETDLLNGGALVDGDYNSGTPYNVPFGDGQFSEFGNNFNPAPKFRLIGNSWESPLFINIPENGIIQDRFDIKGKILYGIGGPNSPASGATFRTTVYVFDDRNNIKYSNVFERYIPFIAGNPIINYDINIDIQNLEIQKYWKLNIVYTAIVDDNLGPKDIRCYTGTNISISTYSKSISTDSKVYMVHETLSRIAESITDNALTVKSDYFGRTDSNINPASVDGAGSLRCLNNGYLLRNAVLADKSTPKFTASFKDIIEGLNAIDAIGYGIEGDKLRIEPWEYFYTDDVILRCTDIKKITRTVNPEMCFALANIGYAKWEAEEWNGIDGFHGKHQYRTKLKNVDTKLEQFCKLVADSYAIEATRRRGISDPSKDWRYDNDIFIFDLKRILGGFSVNTGNGDATTLIDPNTVFNVELSPARNAARWFSYIMQGVKPVNGDQLIFTSSEGYSGAKTTSTKSNPVMYGSVLESQNLSLSQINKPSTPKFKPEIVEFDYYLSISDFEKIRNNPYGLIEFDGEYGWINEIDADILEGAAKFSLKPKL